MTVETGASPAALPLPLLAQRAPARSGIAWSITPMGANGRLPDRVCLQELGWQPGDRIRVQAGAGLVIITADDTPDQLRDNEKRQVEPCGRLRLLTVTRRVAGFMTGERLLMIADLHQQALIISGTSRFSQMLSSLGETNPLMGVAL